MTLHSVMNDTKWDELRLAMYTLGKHRPRWRTLDAENGHLSDWDGEWYYHFREGGYATIEWVELDITSDEQREAVLARLRAVHVPGDSSPGRIKVYGFTRPGHAVDDL